jgi:hypothetical protein
MYLSTVRDQIRSRRDCPPNTAIFFILRNYEMKAEIYCFVEFYDCQTWNILYHNPTKDCLSWNHFRPK